MKLLCTFMAMVLVLVAAAHMQCVQNGFGDTKFCTVYTLSWSMSAYSRNCMYLLSGVQLCQKMS